MFALLRAGLVAALAAFACVAPVASSAFAQDPTRDSAKDAEKAFQRDDLELAAVRLEVQIKNDAGQVTKPSAQLRREMEEAFKKNDFRLGLQLLGQVI